MCNWSWFALTRGEGPALRGVGAKQGDNIDTSIKFIRNADADIFVTERVAFVTIPPGPQTRRGVGEY